MTSSATLIYEAAKPKLLSLSCGPLGGGSLFKAHTRDVGIKRSAKAIYSLSTVIYYHITYITNTNK